jgi:hypothetical protein
MSRLVKDRQQQMLKAAPFSETVCDRKPRANHKGKYGTGKRCDLLDPIDAAYAAGLIDGEGYIGMCYRKPNPKYEYGAFCPLIAINMNSKGVLQWLATFTAIGNVLGPYEKGGNRAPGFQWSVTSAGAASFAEQIRPYLKVKQPSADLLIEVDAELSRNPARMRDQEWLMKVKATFHDLNARGTHGPSRKNNWPTIYPTVVW